VTDDATLAALRVSDSFLPTGGDSLSYGLEQFVADGRVEDADDLRAFLTTALRRQVGRCDAIALRAAHAGAGDDDLDQAAAADRRLTAATLAPEFRESAETAGGRLLDVAVSTVEDPRVAAYAERVDSGSAPGSHPAVFGLVAAAEGIGPREATLAFAHAFVTGLLAAAQRLLRLGHTETQELLVDLRPEVSAAADEAADRTLDDLEPFAPLVAIASARHERADRRLFVS
jgi:urease accessory protein